MKNKIPLPYIQNHINWCWATSSKIVGFHYLKKKSLPLPCCWEEVFPYGVVVNEQGGLIAHTLGKLNGEKTVDAWQYKIVENAKDHQKNPTGALPEHDAAKVRALKYVITGDVSNSLLPIKENGFYNDAIPLYRQECFDEIAKTLKQGFSLLGNYCNHNNTAHSVVIIPNSNQHIMLYNPQVGSNYIYSYRQAFETGFLTETGQAVIQWVQYIIP